MTAKMRYAIVDKKVHLEFGEVVNHIPENAQRVLISELMVIQWEFLKSILADFKEAYKADVRLNPQGYKFFLIFHKGDHQYHFIADGEHVRMEMNIIHKVTDDISIARPFYSKVFIFHTLDMIRDFLSESESDD